MSKECDVIRDLLPLYADNVVSDASREIIEQHLPECPGCRDYLKELQDDELESRLTREKNAVIAYGARRFKRRSAVVGSAVSGFFIIPILVILFLKLFAAPTPGWYYIVLASLLVAASLVVVPLTVSEDKLFWTFCAFCASLIVLLGVTCLSTHGDWFLIASSATLFGLSAVSLPFAVRARPVRKLVGRHNKVMAVLSVDLVLFLNMIYMIATRGRITGLGILFTLGILAGIGWVFIGIIKNRRNEQR